MSDTDGQPAVADRFVARAFYDRASHPGVFHPCYPESATDFFMNVMALALRLQASERDNALSGRLNKCP